MVKTYELQKACEGTGIKPIIGCEFYVGDTEERNAYHLIALAKNQTGLKNLLALQEYSYMENFYYKPKITKEMLFARSEGLIVTTACLGSQWGQSSIEADVGSMRFFTREYQDIFGEDFYLELQPNSMPQQRNYNEYLVRISHLYNVPLTVSCDAHYVAREDASSHDTMLAIQTKKKKNDENRFRFTGDEYFMMDGLEIIDSFDYLPQQITRQAILNTHAIAEKCNAKYEYQHLLPTISSDENQLLSQMCNEGYTWRFGKVYKEEYIQRISYELSVIKEKGFAGYFLIVQDYIQKAREQGILVGPGRGSAAGSLVAYILGITDIDPVKYGLLFERFLNPERNSDPDIDTDFDYARRGEVIQYIKEKYGNRNVATIIAEGSFTNKNVCRKVMSAHNVDQRIINATLKLVEDENLTFSQALIRYPTFSQFMALNPTIREEISILEGLMSHESKHAAGLLISPVPLASVIPVKRDNDDNTMLKSQFHKKIVEKLGLAKFDLLGLKTLTLLNDALIIINRNYQTNIITLEDIPLDDAASFELLCSGDTSGIFQFDGASGKKTIDEIQPTCFDDLIAANALCRPGVKEKDLYLKNKRFGSVNFANPVEREILGETYGAIVYQEQTMLLMNKMAGWSLGKADGMRKVEDLDDYRSDFIYGCLDRGYEESYANKIYSRFSLLYSFNKSHAACYALIAMWCTWLKTNYYPEFMTALLNLEMDKGDSKETLPILINELTQRGLKVLPPSINNPSSSFELSLDRERIFYPLGAIDRVGKTIVDNIQRQHNAGAFLGVEDFLSRFQRRDMNIGTLEKLAKSGAFDEFNANRSAVLCQMYDLRGSDKASGVMTWSPTIAMQYELESIGMFLKFDPMHGYPTRKFDQLNPLQEEIVYGIITKVSIIKDRNNNDMGFITLNTKADIIEGLMFSHTLQQYRQLCHRNMAVAVRGNVSSGKLKINQIQVL